MQLVHIGTHTGRRLRPQIPGGDVLIVHFNVFPSFFDIHKRCNRRSKTDKMCYLRETNNIKMYRSSSETLVTVTQLPPHDCDSLVVALLSLF